jgi:8-oxo-dGTP pyrophosphatase MutT (NUDIX family)
MKILKILDSCGYNDDMPVIKRETVRGIVMKNGKIAMQKSSRGEYKIPGGGIEGSENHFETLIRELKEEIGMIVIPESVKEIGEIIEVRCDKFESRKKFERHTYYYFCDVTEERYELELTDSEKAAGFECVWETPENIYKSNRNICRDEYCIRDTLFIKMLVEGKFKAV